MTRVAFCGLGQMGLPMAQRLVGAGHEVHAWNRSGSKAEALEGATIAETPADAARDAEAVITMLSTPEAAREVVAGNGGVAGAMAANAALIEMSTIGPKVVHELRAALPTSTTMLDAPVLGSVPQASNGELKVMIGGDSEVLARWSGLLETFGTIWHMGELGQGAAMKLVVNSTLGALMTALGEALALAKGLNLDIEKVFDILVQSPIAVTATSKRSNVLSGSYRPNFKLGLAAKDMCLVEEAAESAEVELRVAAAARWWFDAALASGMEELDYSAVIAEIMQERAGPDKA
jgi:3-hydroxyisobutyrate dehydrogenase-like beta-hydroxyacid dehydrogenase